MAEFPVEIGDLAEFAGFGVFGFWFLAREQETHHQRQLLSRTRSPRKIRAPFQTGCGAARRGHRQLHPPTRPTRMSATHPLSYFHQWLFASTAPPCPSRTIVLHGGSAASLDPLVGEIVEYLNEYDGEGDGRWLAATSDLVRSIAESPDSRRLLGMAESCSECPPESPCDIRRTLTALGCHGHVVFRSETTREKPLDLPAAFHAGVGSDHCGRDECHLVLNPGLVQAHSIAHMVSDVFLDWHQETIRTGFARSSENAASSASQDQPRLRDAASS